MAEDKTLVNLEWVQVTERAENRQWGGCRYEVYEGAPYQTYERGAEAFKTLDEVRTFLEKQAEIHREVAVQYTQALVRLTT